MKISMSSRNEIARSKRKAYQRASRKEKIRILIDLIFLYTNNSVNLVLGGIFSAVFNLWTFCPEVRSVRRLASFPACTGCRSNWPDYILIRKIDRIISIKQPGIGKDQNQAAKNACVIGGQRLKMFFDLEQLALWIVSDQD